MSYSDTIVRAARAHVCGGTTGGKHLIATGDEYVRTVVFPGDVNASGRPWVMRICFPCWTQYDKPLPPRREKARKAPPLYVHRIVVESWPTPDGRPWSRFYGDDPAYWGQRIDPDADLPDEIPEWLEPLLNEALPHVYKGRFNVEERLWRIAARLKYHEGPSVSIHVVGVIMPKASRRHYLSASGAHELAKDMRAFGAVVRVERSLPVEWVTS